MSDHLFILNKLHCHCELPTPGYIQVHVYVHKSSFSSTIFVAGTIPLSFTAPIED